MMTEKTLERTTTHSEYNSSNRYRNPTYNIVSIMAYLIGVDIAYYAADDDKPRPQIEVYEKLKKDKNARIIRNLCLIRTCFEKHFLAICNAFFIDCKNIGTVPNYIPSETVNELAKDGVTLFHTRPDANQYLIDINREISNRINNVKNLFPEWLKWEYIRSLFIMPNGLKVEGLKSAGYEYKANLSRYPYQCYVNWPGGNNGNILYNDEKFLTLLYICHEDNFEDLNLVRDASSKTYDNIYNFINTSTRVLIVVDCENSDPIKLAACLSGLAARNIEKIHQVLLVDSNYTTTGWELLRRIPNLVVEHIKIPRIVEHKSQVDLALTAHTCREVYKNGVDSVVLVSSDSDYWALIQTLSDVDFMVLAENGKCGANMRAAMESKGIYYCYIDDFCTHASYSIKTAAVTATVQDMLDAEVRINVDNLLDSALRATWMDMTPKEKESFKKRYLQTLHVRIADDGNLRLEIDS